MLSAQEWIDYFKNEKHYTADETIAALDRVGSWFDEGQLILYYDYSWTGPRYLSDVPFYELENYFFSHN